jgi:hypothetical protein
MTELYTCTDCGAEIDFDMRSEHMQAEHGVHYAIPVPHAPDCQQCERAKALEGT